MAGCFSKFFLFVLNFAIFGIGVAVIVLASLILSQTGDFDVLLSSGVMTVPIIFLIFGLAVTFLGFFGCCGALRENPCMLYTYGTVVLVLFLGQVAIVIYGFVEEDVIREAIATGMKETMDGYNESTESAEALDKAQNSLQCCGVNNYTDWYTGVIDSGMTEDVALGCCRNMESAGCNTGIKGLNFDDVKDRIYTTGCYTKLEQTIESEALWLIIGGVVLAIVQLACVTIACGLGKQSSDSGVY